MTFDKLFKTVLRSGPGNMPQMKWIGQALLSIGGLLFSLWLFVHLPDFCNAVFPIARSFSIGVVGLDIILATLLAFPRLRRSIGKLLWASSWVHGAALFCFSVLTVYGLWGYVGLGVGVMLAGIGVALVAAVALIVTGNWGTLVDLLVLCLFVLVTGLGGAVLMSGEPVSRGRKNRQPPIEKVHEPQLCCWWNNPRPTKPTASPGRREVQRVHESPSAPNSRSRFARFRFSSFDSLRLY